jgi:glucose 1-dehydrogenase
MTHESERQGAKNCRGLLNGQTAVVTGSSSGIGAGIARSMAAAGANVVINYYSSREGAEKVLGTIREGGGNAIMVRADVSRRDQVEYLFQQAIGAFGTVDILVNNAGIQKDASFETMSLDDWNSVLAINLTGGFICSQAAVREFLSRGVVEGRSRSAGKIIFISSVHEEIPWAGHVNYSASKGGVRMLMKSMALELAPRNIRVNGIAPGAIKTPINRDAWETPEARQNLLKLIPCDRIGETGDIGRAAVWLASDESAYMQGTTLFIDGGMMLYPGFAHGG